MGGREFWLDCAGVQFSRDSIDAFNDRIKIREREGCEQSTFWSVRRTLNREVQVRALAQVSALCSWTRHT